MNPYSQPFDALLADGPDPDLGTSYTLFGQFVGSWDLDVVYHGRMEPCALGRMAFRLGAERMRDPRRLDCAEPPRPRPGRAGGRMGGRRSASTMPASTPGDRPGLVQARASYCPSSPDRSATRSSWRDASAKGLAPARSSPRFALASGRRYQQERGGCRTAARDRELAPVGERARDVRGMDTRPIV